MLTKLPSELLDMVIDQISSRGDLKRLCEVCGHLYGRTMPYLYRRSLTLSAPNLSLDDLAVAFEGISREYSRYTKDLGFNIPAHLIAPGYREGFPRCVHKSSDGVADPFSILNLALSSPSLRFPADQLETFRWEVPTCIPSNLFCGNDAFLRNQRNIRSITLITDSICPANVMTQNAVDLVQFKKLQSLNWKGLNPFGNYKALSACIKAHGHQIRSLTLDILSDIHEDHKWLRSYLVHEEGLTLPAVYPPNFLALKVFNLERGSRRVIFDSLENLHLTSVSFGNMELEMIHAFNIEQLKSLRLRRCGSSLKWLQEILKSGNSMNLKSFEFAVRPSWGHISRQMGTFQITDIICGFIRHNPELENLSLMLPEDCDWATLANTLSSHHHLKHLVMHKLGVAPSMHFGNTKVMDASIPWSVPLESLLSGNQLTSFGSPTPPGDLKFHFQMMKRRPSLKLIHFRISSVFLKSIVSWSEPDWHFTYKNLHTSEYWGTCRDGSDDASEEIFSFAEWAFSADGLPDLQIVAGGDFSYQGRYSKLNIILCRSNNTRGYEILTHPSASFERYVHENRKMLSACPWDEILYNKSWWWDD